MAEDPRDPTDVDVAHQPSLPSLELPEYHGRQPVGMKTSVNGAGNRISRPHSIGDRVVAVIELKVKTAGHEETDDGLVYAEKHKVVDFFEVQGDPGARLLSAVRNAYRTADDAKSGREPLPDLGTAGVTDASGVALTPSELAELAGLDPVRAMLDDDATPVVVLYSDGARELWPDDFDGGAPRPTAGEKFDAPGDGPADYVYVEKLLHAETGETVAEWTPEQEDARLLELEEQQAAEEARAESSTPDDVDGTTIPQEVDEEAPLDDWEIAGEEVDDLEDLEDGDTVEDFDEGLEPMASPEPELPEDDDDDQGADVVDFPGAAAKLAAELAEPDDTDYALVDRKVPEVVAGLAHIGDLNQARRLVEAEKRGRGRGLKPRSSLLDALHARVAELEAEQAMADGPDDGEAF